MYLISIAIIKYITRVYLKISKYFKVEMNKNIKRASIHYFDVLFI